MVQLKLIEKVNPSHPDKDFNSIMVQLKQVVDGYQGRKDNDFNSIMVQLKLKISDALTKRFKISIP